MVEQELAFLMRTGDEASPPIMERRALLCLFRAEKVKDLPKMRTSETLGHAEVLDYI